MNKIDLEKQLEVRTRYLDSVTAKILGPGSEPLLTDDLKEDFSHEVISESPKNRYITGMLFPKDDKDHHYSDDEADEAASRQEDFDPESEPAVVDNSFKPNSMGITFYCNTQSSIKVYLSGSTYQSERNPRLYLPQELVHDFKRMLHDSKQLKDVIDYSDKDDSFAFTKEVIQRNPTEGLEAVKFFLNNNRKQITDTKILINTYLNRLCTLNTVQKKTGKSKKSWIRKPFDVTVDVDVLKSTDHLKIQLDGERSGLVLFSKVVKLPDKQVISPTLILMNKDPKQMFYQCEIRVEADKNCHFIAAEDVHVGDVDKLLDEDARLQFSYQDRKTYAFGHGVSATWNPLNGSSPAEIKTTYVPISEITPMKFTIDGMDPNILRPDSYLEEKSSASQISMLYSFVEAYEEWIKQKKIEAPKYTKGNKKYQSFANDNLDKCLECSKRMKTTIQRIENDPLLLKAFDIANEAILMQRIQNLDTRKMCYQNRDYSVIQSGHEKFMWRPFQLAFILTTLGSVIDKDDPDRDKLDLIWVTTGGGKTEAYLFAIAASISYQRLNDQEDHGVSVIMRYTLRLLTAQQFDRAAALICTLEFMRHHDFQLGKYPISIGLWVGGASTPNDKKTAEKVLTDMISNNGPNGFQVLKCPWCHQDQSLVPSEENRNLMHKWGYYSAIRPNKNFDMKCLNPACEFSEQLPLYVVDSMIYKQQPTLLFGTVDKFAQVPLKGETANLFCAKSKDESKIYLPKLIIQDELHLISGPLGSVVGLYEAGFDYIISRHGNRPKYLASTATIRNSEEQIKNIYGRSVVQFPPDGLRADDSFFVSPENHKIHGREYLGVMGTGKSQVTAEVHMFAAMLATINELKLPDYEKELFWTTVGYFNSIRELGKASTLLVDDVQDELKNITKWGYDNEKIRFLKNNVELTSRIKSTKITQTLSDLEVKYEQGFAVDTVIATNMLSVGIDISRLNAMLVVGQPKLTSEYIQATSRVGRNTLGAVFTLYNAMRSRDRSHYETFTSYHQSMYRYVEPSSVTPFSQPALKRALAAVLVTMMRYSVTELQEDDGAINIINHTEELEAAKQFILGRIKDNDEHNLYLTPAENLLNDFIKDWISRAELVRDLGNDKLMYYLRGSRKGNRQYLLVPYEGDSLPREKHVMNSMRDIEETTYLEVKGDVGYRGE